MYAIEERGEREPKRKKKLWRIACIYIWFGAECCCRTHIHTHTENTSGNDDIRISNKTSNDFDSVAIFAF